VRKSLISTAKTSLLGRPKGLINDFKDLVYSKYPQFQDIEKSFEIVISKVLGEGTSFLTPKAFPEGSRASLGIKGRIGLSGTGSTLFAVFEDEESASKAYDLLKNFLKGGKIYLARNLKG
jgi:hypothetical protein